MCNANYPQRRTVHPNVLVNQIVVPSDKVHRLKWFKPSHLVNNFKLLLAYADYLQKHPVLVICAT